MIDLQKMIKSYENIGYGIDDATSKVAQDVILILISRSKYSKNITIKGGVVMHSLSNDVRRATRDLDLDFIKYSLKEESIIKFIKELNNSSIGASIEIVGKIMPLHHQDYNGQRVFVRISDTFNNKLESKLDIGVHKLFELEQEEYCFNFEAIGESANLIINSFEQMFTEKLKSLLKFGIRSTRYKDLFDFDYLINNNKLNKDKLINCFSLLIYNDINMKEKNLEDIIKRYKNICSSKMYISKLENPKYNWLRKNTNDVVNNILNYLESLETVEV